MTPPRRQVTSSILTWSDEHGRQFPWRATRDPYLVLVAELLLQRTPYWKAAPAYERLVALAPSPADLAHADLGAVESIVRPLGLLRRAHSLIALGKALVERHGGVVPRELTALRALPGVGQYVGSAVQCFAFGEPVALVDGLTGRFYRRLLGLPGGREPHADPDLWQAVAALQPGTPREFHLAVIDLTSLICRPRRPRCGECPVLRWCATGRLAAPGRQVGDR